MKRCAYQEKSVMAACDEERIDSVVCPKPRRLGILNPCFHEPTRPQMWPLFNQQAESGDSIAGAELLDLILTKGGYGGEKPSNQVASSPPYFCGSSPSRASNPVIQDAQFGNEKMTPFSLVAPPSPSSRLSGGCTRMKFGHRPAAVRIEGFDCLSRDRCSCSISAVA
ncbi:hypothetical protein CFOL_v3_08784 [Cephalotus follicularis]|uniref:Uncharacterized protein n=1 Tax=Cephalotus follicularis TaxID=3775 RepID=A0A1Q3BBI2_CEPFO|nr:hypothetical protein CFOL_v3_08784 [Cephalotus follicularis]